MQGNIIGEKFEDFVLTQIKNRQTIQNKGFGKGTTRSSEEKLYLNNRNAWVKLASGVSIEGIEGDDKLKRVIPTYKDFTDDKLAKNFILFNTVSSLVTSTDNQNQNTLSNNRSGVTKTNSIWNNKAYGLGGTEFGINPAPGITDVQVTCVNRGSIRNATITITAFNKSQFEIIELLFLRLGYTMMLEWGWDKYLDKDGKLQDTGITVIEEFWFDSNSHQKILGDIQQKRSDYCGNYDGFMGKVVNFDWTLNSDGNYEIILKLVTVGDVIESLNVNTGGEVLTDKELKVIFKDLKTEKDDETIDVEGISEETKILQLGKYTPFSQQFLFDLAATTLWEDPKEKDFINIAFLLKSLNPTLLQKFIAFEVILPEASLKEEKYQYFISFRKFMDRIEEFLIPSIKSKNGDKELMLEIDSSIDDTLINHSPYVLSFDITVCLFKPEIPDRLNGSKIFIDSAHKEYFTSVFENLLDFKVKKEKETYGKLMHMYLNYDFIAKCLESNTDDEGRFSLFKFLQAICGGINSSLANTTKLKPILKDDKIITIVDDNFHQETPIPEVTGEEVFLNTFGYNTNDNSSNFLRDISFQTNITPELATQITIGATAGGSTTREVDGTAFGRWNRGLKDRYQYEVLDLKPIASPPKSEFKYDPKFESFISNYRSIFRKNASLKAIETEIRRRPGKEIKFDGRDTRKVNKEQFLTYLQSKINKQKEEDFKKEKDSEKRLSRNLGAQYVKLFSGEARLDGVNTIVERKNTYFSLDKNIINQSKSVYRAWLNYTNNKFLQKQNKSSTQAGFLPLQVGLVLDGLSGMKIYNELLLTQSNILPYYYPRSLKFIITQVNHTITGNDWTTSLDTLSQPKVVVTNQEIEEVQQNLFVGPLELEPSELTAL